MAALSAFNPYIAHEVPGCPQPVLEAAVLRACIDFCERTSLFDEATTVAVVAGTSEYAMAFASTLVSHRVLNVRRDGAALSRSNREALEASGLLDDSNTPSHYYQTGTGKLRLAPIPNATETLDVTAVVKPAYDAATVPDALLQDWAVEIGLKAKAILYAQKNTAWYDVNEATKKEREFSDAVNTAINRIRSGGAGGVTRVQMRPAA